MAKKTQLEHFHDAHRRLADADATFMEVMRGPNPLTPEEVRALIDRRPGLWGRFEKWAAPKE